MTQVQNVQGSSKKYPTGLIVSYVISMFAVLMDIVLAFSNTINLEFFFGDLGSYYFEEIFSGIDTKFSAFEFLNAAIRMEGGITASDDAVFLAGIEGVLIAGVFFFVLFALLTIIPWISKAKHNVALPIFVIISNFFMGAEQLAFFAILKFSVADEGIDCIAISAAGVFYFILSFLTFVAFVVYCVMISKYRKELKSIAAVPVNQNAPIVNQNVPVNYNQRQTAEITSSGKCPVCGRANKPGSKFCAGCGNKL